MEIVQQQKEIQKLSAHSASCTTPYLLSKTHHFIKLAKQVAQTSDDLDTQVGCIFTNSKHQVISQGSNKLVNGCTSTKIRTTRPTKYNWIEHAERNAIYAAAKAGTSLEGSTIYVTLWPCIDCARAIIQCGCTKVVAKEKPDLDCPRWGDKFKLSIEMFAEVELKYSFASDEVPPVSEQESII